MSHSLPLIDLSLLDGDDADRATLLADVRRAASETGFFYLTGHGVTAAEIDAVFDRSRQFFALPEPDKTAIAMVNSPHFRGYSRPGAELTRGAADWREQLDIGAERMALPDGPIWARLQGPNQWPEAMPALRPALLDWQARVTDVGIRVLRLIAQALGQPAGVFDQAFLPAPVQHLKIIRYPGRPDPDASQGVGAHKDSGYLTILLQDRVAGLQVETAAGWIDAPPVPGTFVVNIGEALEMASNGFLRATVHRVVSPPAGQERYSVAFFLGPRLDATVPLLDLPEALARQASGPETDPLNPLLRDTGLNMLKGRLRSHPDVARRHYPELVVPAAGRPSPERIPS